MLVGYLGIIYLICWMMKCYERHAESMSVPVAQVNWQDIPLSGTINVLIVEYVESFLLKESVFNLEKSL
jgi:hypothetical protein